MRTALHTVSDDDLSAEALQALLVAPWDYAAAATAAAATKAVRLRMLTPAGFMRHCTRLCNWKCSASAYTKLARISMVGHVPGRTCAWRGYRVNQ